MNDFVRLAVNSFSRLLERRIEKGVLTTEDSVRYTFYAALLAEGTIPPDQVVMEYPHPQILSARVDTMLLDDRLTPTVAMEFKYDREIPSGRTAPRPQKAGAVFGDLARLLALPAVESRLLIHLCSAELARYWSEPKNGLSAVFGMKQGTVMEIPESYFSGRCETFRKSVGTWPGVADLSCAVNLSLPRGHELRIYEVEQRLSAF